MEFKICKGDSSRLSFDDTPFHDGWLYFASNNGGLYIDTEDDGTQKRMHLNPKETIQIESITNAEIDAIVAG